MSKRRFALSNEPPKPLPDVRVGWGKPRFLTDLGKQLDAVHGCPNAMLPSDHLARQVWAIVEKLDVSVLEAAYSSLGRHGVHPKRKLAVLIYASLTGVHEATKIARQSKTDMAYRFLAGGRSVSETMMRTFRRENEQFFADAIEQTIKLAAARKLIDLKALAVDSLRLRADASTKSIRTLARSEERLDELARVDTTTLDAAEIESHGAKVHKHQDAVKRCTEEGRTSLSVTAPSAGLLKFPNGAALPGHRVTVVAAGVQFRFVIAVLIGSEPTDYDLLRPALVAARASLDDAGLAGPLQVAADAGYRGHDDLQFSIDRRNDIDVLLHDPPPPRLGKRKRKGGHFSKAEFHFTDGGIRCPAGTQMRGPRKAGAGKLLWVGVGCAQCPLRPQCTDTTTRSILVDTERERLHGAMRERMNQPGAEERYRRRIATVEPVFSYLEDAMGFQRVSSRHTDTVRAEILLKILAYNLYRLFSCACETVALVEGHFDGQRLHTHDLRLVPVERVREMWAATPETYFC